MVELDTTGVAARDGWQETRPGEILRVQMAALLAWQ